MADVYAKLLEIQRDLKCEKSQFNKFGGYSYRSKEDILEAVKPLAHARNCAVIVDDRVVYYPNGWMYQESTAKLHDCESGSEVTATAQAREPESKKGMDAAQITGTSASYAGKRALGNLFAIDDTKDADSLNDHGKADERPQKRKAAPKGADTPKAPENGSQGPTGGFKEAVSAAFLDARSVAVASGIGEDAFKQEWLDWLHLEFKGKAANDFTEAETGKCNEWLRDWAASNSQTELL